MVIRCGRAQRQPKAGAVVDRKLSLAMFASIPYPHSNTPVLKRAEESHKPTTVECLDLMNAYTPVNSCHLTPGKTKLRCSWIMDYFFDSIRSGMFSGFSLPSRMSGQQVSYRCAFALQHIELTVDSGEQRELFRLALGHKELVNVIGGAGAL